MFEDLKDAFRQAVRNFKEELGRDDVPGAVDRLLLAMRSEVTAAQTRLRELEDGAKRAHTEAAREAPEIENCRRRERMALDIGDAETARVAAEYATRHERRRAVLEQKAHALEQELEVRRSEVSEMLDGLRHAERQRGSLSATAGRTQARQQVQDSELFDELERVVEQMGGARDRSRGPGRSDDLLAELDRELERGPPQRAPSAEELDARLEELKRRMARD